MDELLVLNCFICNELTRICESKHIYHESSYSETSISSFIKKFSENEQLTRFSENDIVCDDCWRKIEKYDLACVTAEQVEFELRSALLATEQIYQKEEIVEFLEDDDEIDESTAEFILRPSLLKEEIVPEEINLDDYCTEVVEDVEKPIKQTIKAKPDGQTQIKEINAVFKCGICQDHFKT